MLWLVPCAAWAQASGGSCGAPPVESQGPEAPPETPSCGEAGLVGVRAVAFAWSAPHVALERPLSRAFRYAAHPFADGEPGLLRFGEPVAHLHNPKNAFVARCRAGGVAPAGTGCARRARLSHQRGLLRAALGWSVAEGGRGSGIAEGEARLLTRVRLEPALELSAYRRLEPGAAAARFVGRALLDYRFAQSAHLSLTSGLAALGWASGGTLRLGAALRYGLRAYLRAPWAVRVQAAVGGVAGAFYGRLAGFVDVSVGRVQLGAGYDHVALRGVQVSRLSGPRLVLTLWL